MTHKVQVPLPPAWLCVKEAPRQSVECTSASRAKRKIQFSVSNSIQKFYRSVFFFAVLVREKVRSERLTGLFVIALVGALDEIDSGRFDPRLQYPAPRHAVQYVRHLLSPSPDEAQQAVFETSIPRTHCLFVLDRRCRIDRGDRGVRCRSAGGLGIVAPSRRSADRADQGNECQKAKLVHDTVLLLRDLKVRSL